LPFLPETPGRSYEIAYIRVKVGCVELGDPPLLPPLPQSVEVGNNVLTHLLGTGEFGGLDRPESGSEADFGTGHEPVGEVVSPRVIPERFLGNARHFFLEFPEIRCLVHFRAVRHAENKVAEPEMAQEEVLDL
jgi:hypothetical protein